MTARRRMVLGMLTGTALMIPGAADCQLRIGFSAGVVRSSLTGEDVPGSATPRTGALLGGFASVGLGESFSLEMTAHHGKGGGILRFDDAIAAYRFDQVRTALLLRLAPLRTNGAEIGVFAGPSLAFDTSCSVESDSEGGPAIDADCDDVGWEDRRGTTLGALIGAGVRFMASEHAFVHVDGGADLGLTSIDGADDPSDIRHSAWFVRAGFGWVLGG